MKRKYEIIPTDINGKRIPIVNPRMRFGNREAAFIVTGLFICYELFF